MKAYVTALILSLLVIFGSYKAEAHSRGDAIAGAAIGFGLGLAAGAYARRHHREYFPTGPAYYPPNYYIPSPYQYGQPYFSGPPYGPVPHYRHRRHHRHHR